MSHMNVLKNKDQQKTKTTAEQKRTHKPTTEQNKTIDLVDTLNQNKLERGTKRKKSERNV